MKHWLLVVALVCFGSFAHAAPYFRPLNPAHPKAVMGALLAPEGLKQSEATGLLPLFTHSPADGCMFPSIVCEDWTPLAVGASINAGQVTFAAGPLANVLPWMQRAGLAIVPESWTWARSVLDYGGDETDAVTFSAGPVWQYKQATNKGYFRIFTGLALHF
jgi:hypothetical protein